mmetsp:Transcript_33481/g.66386  ORF Transcript_33481/g.66386 Transcript_33481/m.66386 type:complete len:451 (+) Transcript_33481:194-1546(+)
MSSAAAEEMKNGAKKMEKEELSANVEAEDDEEEDEAGDGAQAVDAKKKRKKKKKKKTEAPLVPHTRPAQDNSALRLVSDWKTAETVQTDMEPTIPIRRMFPDGRYPVGQEVEYAGENAKRKSDAEMKAKEEEFDKELQNARRAAECHRQVRRYAQQFIRPGMPLLEICEKIEGKVEELIEANGLEAGKGFPTGVSLNNCAAHWTPQTGDTKTILKESDIMKVDFGVQVGGRIIDCAWSVAFDPKFDNLIKATQEGTRMGLKMAGIDARFSEIGESIQEVIESFEVELDGKVHRIKSIRNLNGHSIGPYRVHGGKSVPIVKTTESTKMEEGEFYAIETFCSTGKGYVVEDLDVSHYMKDADAPVVPLRLKGAKELLYAINTYFGSLAFCRRWLDNVGQTRHLMNLKNLVDNGIVTPYPPLCDQRGSFTSQMEHTLVLRPTCKEILSVGDDY